MVVVPEEGVVLVSDSPDVVRQALCADVEEDRFLHEVHPRFGCVVVAAHGGREFIRVPS